MRKRTIGVVTVLTVTALVGMLFQTSRIAFSQEGPLKIGLIDLNRVVKECKMGKDRVQELDVAYQEKRTELQKQRDDLTKLAEELKLLDPASDEAANKRKELAEKTALLRAQADVAASEWQRKYAAAHKEVYTEIFKVLTKFRKDNGFHILLRKDALELGQLDPMQVKALLRSNAVLDADPALDVTDKIIVILDQDYSKNK
ncbi:MAG: OmpH family outer membrane protein [Planctomycetes bacterium]|nr:OmpH family outer membrane protein [Planctomycetota bacterium]